LENAFFCFTVDDVGMPVYSAEGHLETLLEFFHEQEVKATFFVVPRPHGQLFHQGNGYVKLLNRAREAGHAVAQHGLEHDRFELGIPPKMILDLPHEGPAREYLAAHRDDIDRSHGMDNLCKRLREGRNILEDALGREIEGFRSPCLQTCENLPLALEAEGYLYDSSGFMQKAGWDLINGESDPPLCPITRDVFDSHQAGGRIHYFPLTAEYTWYLTRDRFESFRNLAIHDFDACLDAGIPFVQLSHVSPIQEGEDSCGLALYRELLSHARQAAARRGKQLVATTLAELSRIWPQGD
jgi:hypothetical protein